MNISKNEKSGEAEGDKIRVLHFSRLINRNDFIDVIVRFAGKDRFKTYAAAWQADSNISEHNYLRDGIPFTDLQIKMGWVHFFKGAWKLSRLLKKEKIALLHTHHFYESVIGWLACLLYPRTKQIFGRHYHDEFYITARGFQLKFYLFVENLVNRFVSAIIVPSNVIKELLLKQGVKEKKIEVVHYGFDFSQPRYQVMSAIERKQKKEEMGWGPYYLIGNFSRHHTVKGLEYLLDAFRTISKELPEARLVMVGDGPLHNKLLEIVAGMQLSDKIFFLGWRKDGTDLMNLMDVIVHPTLQEAFPQTMIEVMSVEVPLIITPVSGVSDVITDNVNGFIIPVRSSAAICEKVLYVYNNPAEVLLVVKAARKHVLNRLSIEYAIKNYENVYAKVLNYPDS